MRDAAGTDLGKVEALVAGAGEVVLASALDFERWLATAALLRLAEAKSSSSLGWTTGRAAGRQLVEFYAASPRDRPLQQHQRFAIDLSLCGAQ
jgi:hypothetical protein